MAGRGPAPGTGAKPDGQRRRRNKPAKPTELPAAPPAAERARPKLPRSYLTGEVDGKGRSVRRQYLADTREWFDELVASPEATQFTAVDTTYLRNIVAPIYDRFVRAPTKDLAAELRLQLTQFGSTPDAKKRQNWEPPKPQPQPAGAASGEVKPPNNVRRLKAVDTSAVAGA